MLHGVSAGTTLPRLSMYIYIHVAIRDLYGIFYGPVLLPTKKSITRYYSLLC